MLSRLVGRLMMLMAPNGHFLGQMPQPMHRDSEMKAMRDSGVTSMQSLPLRTTGHDFLHSWRHFLGLHYFGPTSSSASTLLCWCLALLALAGDGGVIFFFARHTLSLLMMATLRGGSHVSPRKSRKISTR